MRKSCHFFHWLIYSVVYILSVWTHGYLFYSLSYDLVLWLFILFIYVLSCSNFAHWETFRVGLRAFFCVCFICSALSYFLALQAAPGSLLIWHFLCSSPGINCFTKELCFCQLKKKLQNQKMHHLEAADYVLFGGITNRGLCGQGDSLADSSEKQLQGEKGGARIHGRFCWEKKCT